MESTVTKRSAALGRYRSGLDGDGDLSERLRAQVGVTLQFVPGVVKRELRHLVNLVAPFK